MWTKASVDEALKSYTEDKARAMHLEIEIGEMERRYNAAVSSLTEDEASPKAQVITGMPHGTAVGHPTEDIAIRLASGWMPPEFKDMREQIDKLKDEYRPLEMRVRYVEAWLGALSNRERWIMEHQFMKGEFWRDVINDYNTQFGGYVTKDTLKWLRGKAFKTIYAVAGVRN